MILRYHAVSYTHLDVYKRQAVAGGLFCVFTVAAKPCGGNVGKEATPAKMKEQIMTLLDEWKEKQLPELAKAPKKMEKDK